MSVIPSDIRYYGSACMPAFDGAATLNGAISSTTTNSTPINAPTAAFPASGEFAIQVDSEIMWVTQGAPGSSAGTLTCLRGMFGTAAATHSNAAAVSMPSGGPINFLRKVAFAQITSGDLLDYVSTASADTLPGLVATGRDTTGVLHTETKTLNGTTKVAGSQAWGRIMDVKLASVQTAGAAIASGGTTLTLTASTGLPGTGNYNIQMALEILTVTAGQGTTSLTVTRGVNGTTAVAHASGDSIYLLPTGDVAALDHTPVISAHTAQTGSANPTGTTPALMKLQSGDGSSVSIGQVIQTTGGTGPNQMRTIIATSGYGTDVVAVSRSWGTVPDNTTTYNVNNGLLLDLAPNQITEVGMFLWGAAADIPSGSTRTFYEQFFGVNDNTATALTGASVEFASETASLPSGASLDLATATAANGNVTTSNRQTAPGSGFGSFVVQPAFANYGANSGNLASGAAPNAAGAQSIAARLTLLAGTASYLGFVDTRTQGTTT